MTAHWGLLLELELLLDAFGGAFLLASFVTMTEPLPLPDPLPLADPRMLMPEPFVVIVAEDEPLPVSTVASEPVPPCSLHPASANAAAKIISSFFMLRISMHQQCLRVSFFPSVPSPPL